MNMDNLKTIAESPLAWAILAIIFVMASPYIVGPDGKEYIMAVLAVLISRIRSPRNGGQIEDKK